MTIDWEFFSSLLIRWGHVQVGVLWLGALYAMLLIQGPALDAQDPEIRRRVLPALLPRASWWLRWSSTTALLLGVLLFLWEYHRVEGGFGINSNLRAGGEITNRSLFIMCGITIGLVLWSLIWFVIWPAQRRIVAAVEAGEAPPAAMVRRSRVWARVNAALSGPLLMLMIAPQNYLGAFNLPTLLLMMVTGSGSMLLLVVLGARVRVGST